MGSCASRPARLRHPAVSAAGDVPALPVDGTPVAGCLRAGTIWSFVVATPLLPAYAPLALPVVTVTLDEGPTPDGRQPAGPSDGPINEVDPPIAIDEPSGWPSAGAAAREG